VRFGQDLRDPKREANVLDNVAHRPFNGVNRISAGFVVGSDSRAQLDILGL
jgi:hypothetical protein